MKIFAATLLAAALFLARADETADEIDEDAGETKCPCDGPTCLLGSGDDKFHKCSWTQQCHESSNKSWSMCIPKGNIVCYKYQFLGESGVIVGAASHHPSMSCCDDAACNSRQTCVEVNGGAGSFDYDFDENGALVSYSVADVERNDWKNKKGEAFQNRPKVCVDRIFDVTQGTRQIIAPFGSMFVIVLALILMFVKNQDGCLALLLPILVLVASFFLCLSEGWIFALFTALVAVATVSTSAAHQGKLVLFLLAFTWLYFGGMNVLFAWGVKDTPPNYFLKTAQHSLEELEATCSTHFNGYYDLLAVRKPWNVDTTFTTSGLCGRGFISFLIIVAYGQALAFFAMVAFKALAFLGVEVSSSSKAGRCLSLLPCFRSGSVKPKESEC